MEKFEELFQKLTSKPITQAGPDWAEDIPEDIWKNYFEGNFEIVAKDLDVDKHRWYATSLTVVKIFGGFLGVRFVSNIFSESMGYEDLFWEIAFTRMREIQITSYEIVD